FTLYLPLKYAGPSSPARDSRAQTAVPLPAVRVADAPQEIIPDDRADLHPEDFSLLIVEDDPRYARVLIDIAHREGFKALVAQRGSDPIELAREFNPTAISLDVFLPDMLGWTVLSNLNKDPKLRHIPVQIFTVDEDRQHGLSRGAFSFVNKPATTAGLEVAFAKIREYCA